MAELTAPYTVAYRDRGVVGIGLGGPEAEYPPEAFGRQPSPSWIEVRFGRGHAMAAPGHSQSAGGRLNRGFKLAISWAARLPAGHRRSAVVSADAFHWIDPELRFSNLARLLSPSGWLAVLSLQHFHDEPLSLLFNLSGPARSSSPSCCFSSCWWSCPRRGGGPGGGSSIRAGVQGLVCRVSVRLPGRAVFRGCSGTRGGPGRGSGGRLGRGAARAGGGPWRGGGRAIAG